MFYGVGLAPRIGFGLPVATIAPTFGVAAALPLIGGRCDPFCCV